MDQFSTAIPDHVPDHLLREYPLAARRVIYENPYDGMMQKVHEGPAIFMAPNAYMGVGPAWVVRRFADINSIFADNEHFIKKGNSGFSALIGETWDAIPTELDPPRHTEVRRVLNPLFTPGKVAQLEGKVRQRAQEYIARLKEKGSGDLALDFAVPYPVSIFLDLFGLPQEGMEKFLEWEYSLIHADRLEDRAAGVFAVKAYLMDVIEERRRNPTGDLISNALAITINGVPLTTIEVFGHCFNLYIGGLDTVTATISLHMHHLATHLDHQRQLRENPELIKTAMNELLRAYSPTVHNRICAQEYEIAGVRMMPGDKVVLVPPLGNRDPEHWDAPDEIRFDRVGQNLTFGSGVHNCLGRHLARREVQVALEEVLSALPEFHLAADREIPFRVGSVIHAAEVPIEW
jgi:cytochrome P450